MDRGFPLAALPGGFGGKEVEHCRGPRPVGQTQARGRSKSRRRNGGPGIQPRSRPPGLVSYLQHM